MDDKRRTANGVMAIALLVFFFAHALMGMLEEAPMGMVAFALMWAAVAVTMAHVAFCIMTSNAMLKDEARPPSRRKKQHLALKWVSGVVLLVVAVVHCQVFNGAGMLLAVLLVGALAWHGWVGAKSLASDLHISKKATMPYRATIGVLTAILLVQLAVVAVG